MRTLIGTTFISVILLAACTSGGGSGSEDVVDAPLPPEVLPVDSPFGAHGVRENNNVSTEELFSELEAIGVKYKRLAGSQAMVWGLIDPEVDGVYDWTSFDEVLSLANQHDISLVVTIKSGNEVDRESCGTPNPCDQAMYEAFLRAAVRRYGSQIKYWQPENEVSSIFYDGTPAEYAELLSSSYQVITNNCTDCEVLIAGMPDVGLESGEYYGEVLDSLQCDCFDIFDVHTPFRGGHEVLQQSYDESFALLETYGYSEKPIWSTEFSSLQADEDNIAEELPKMFAVALSAGFEKLFWRVSECPSCILDGPESPTATYDAYRELIAQVDGYSSVTRESESLVRFDFPDQSSTYISLDTGAKARSTRPGSGFVSKH